MVTSTSPASGYSLDNARAFGWSSITGELSSERRELLDKHVVGPDVLDAGCGGGGIVHYLSSRGLTATGLEKHNIFLDVARQRGFQGSFVEADLSEPLPFADASFDTTICLDVLEHLPDDAATLREIVRVTRRRLIVAVPQEDHWMPSYRLLFYPYRDPTHLRYYTPESLRALVDGPWASRVDVFGEVPILAQRLALDLLKPRSRYPAMTRAYRRAFRFLVDRAEPDPMFINLVAVVDLHG